MADTFNRAKLRLLDRAMRDGRLTASRLVFYEIIQHVNRVSGDAWPSELRLAKRLHIDVKTVKRALPPLKLCEYIEVQKKGRHNTYRPVFEEPAKGDNLSRMDPGDGGADGRTPGDTTWDKLSGNRGQFVHSIGDKNGPLSSLREPHQENLSKNIITATSLLSRAREGFPNRQQEDPLESRSDDGGIHLLLINELGSDIVDALYNADSGRPLKLLTTQRRQRPLTPVEKDHARSLAAGELRRRTAGPPNGTGKDT